MATINNTNSNTLLSGTSNKDYILNEGSNVTISGGKSSDYIDNYNGGNKVTINGNEGSDDIYNEGSMILISGDDGDDTISSYGDYVTINGGVGIDSISNWGNKVTLFGGAGNDSIYNSKGYGDADGVLADGGIGNDYIRNFGSNSTLTGGDGNDTIGNYKYQYSRNTIDGCGSNVTINSGNGNDSICNSGFYVSINAGTGNDIIQNGGFQYNLGGSYVTINAGAGNDTVNLGSEVLNNVIKYANGDGNDIIYGIKSDSTVQIATNSGYTTQKSGNNLIIKVGSGKMTFKNGANKSFKISTVKGGNSDTKANTKKTQQNVIKAFMYSLDKTTLSGTAALDEAVKYASGGKFKTYKSLIEKFVTDCRNATSVDKFLKEKCNIDLSNSDTGAITGWDAGGIAVKTAESIVEEKGKLQPYKSSFTLPHEKSGLSLVWKAPKKVTSAQKKIVQGLYSWWFKGALDLVTESYGLDFKKSDTVHKITLDFDDVKNSPYVQEKIRKGEANPDSWIAMTHSYPEEPDDGITRSLSLWINMKQFNSFNPSKDVNGIVKDSNQLLDSSLAHEFTHAIMSANIHYHTTKMPSLIKEGMAELTEGGDYRSIDSLLKNFRSRTQTNVVNSLLNDKEDAYTAGYTLLRYFAKQASNVPEGVHTDSDKTKILLASDYTGTTFSAEDYFSTIKEIDASVLKSKVKLVGNSLANTIKGGRKDDNLLGGAGADKLYGNAGNDILKGSAGSDSLWGGLGNDTLWGDAGKDTFIYASGEGKDVIYGFENNDLLKITGAFSASYSKSKGEVYFKVGTTSKAITLSDFSATSFNINGTNYKISGTKLVKK